MPKNPFEQLHNKITNQIVCSKCEIEFMKAETGSRSLQEYSMLDAGFTNSGLQVWCRRHDVNVVHVDFDGNRLKADFRSLEPKLQ